MFFLLLMQEHPFFTLHDSKDTDVASFVKVILDDWWAPAGAPAHQGRRGPLSKTNQWPTPVFLFFFLFFVFFKLTGMTDSHVPTHNRTEGGGGGMTQRRTAAQQHWSGRVVVIWTLYGQKKKKPNWRGLIQSSKLPVCAFIQHGKYELNPIVFFFFFFLSCSFSVFCPTAPFYLSLQKWTEPAITLFVTHIVWVLWISSAKKPTVNVYVVYWKLYLHMYVFFSHYAEFWYCISSVNFYQTRALFVRSDRVRWTRSTWFYPDGDRSSAVGAAAVAGAVGGSRAETKTRKKCQRSHSGRGGVASHS